MTASYHIPNDGFQSTPSRGGRPCVLLRRCCALPVSIHALAWRATWMDAALDAAQDWFQSTPSRGGRPFFKSRPTLDTLMFQSTPSRGGRPYSGTCAKLYLKFQSTPSRGGRPELIKAGHIALGVSIHALAWRATLSANTTQAL